MIKVDRRLRREVHQQFYQQYFCAAVGSSLSSGNTEMEDIFLNNAGNLTPIAKDAATKRPGTFYHGWYIEIIRQDDEFFFQCYPPQLDFCNDASAYASFDAAWVAACRFVDRELAVLSVMDCVAAWFDSGKINEAEYWNLTSFD